MLAVALAIALGAGAGGARSAEAADDPAAWLLSPGTVAEIDLELPPESIEALNDDPGEYQDGTFSLTAPGHEYGPLDVGIRLKGGHGSFRPLSGKAAFKVKLAHSVAGQRFLGLKTLTLNNMVQDDSMIHEVLAYEAFRSAGIAAPRTGYAFVAVNAEDYGLYLNVETVDNVMLPRWFDSTKHLYEGEYGADVSPGGAGDFEVEQGSAADLSDLEGLIAAVNQPTDDWSDGVQALADLQQLTRMWAVEKYIGHWDGYAGATFSSPNNYYLHSDSAGVFTMLPWGTDQTWGVLPWTGERVPFDEEAGLMFNECLGDASCLALYREAVSDVRHLIEGLDLDSLATATAAALAPWQAADPRREYSLEQIERAVADTREYLRVRPADVDAWLNPASPTDGGLPPEIVPEIEAPAEMPETTITDHRRSNSKRAATFEFSSSHGGGGFECSLNGSPFGPCASPLTVKPRRGDNLFAVRATGPAGGVDPTPATFEWKVKKKRRRR
jgi:hypothetical protein